MDKTPTKGSTAELLPSLHSAAMTTVTPGDPLQRSMGQYGKDAGKAPVRGGAGGIKPNPKFGALGAGQYGAYGGPSGFGVAGDNS